MICTNCNATVPEGNAFCHLCGANISDRQQGSSLRERRLEKMDRIVERRRTQVSDPAAGVVSTASRYSGASLVATTLWVIGWIIAVGGVILGAYLASEYEPEFDQENEGAIRFGIFVGTALAAWLYAVLVLWMAYALRLLSDIERNTAGGRSAG